jgi:adenylate cyclase
MILPFDDLSPTADNQWFADGIVSELINALSGVKALRTMDAQTTKDFRSYKGQLTIYAREMGIRYFVQGDVRKFGDQIKISSRLLDIQTGDHLWQDSLKGTMDDIFEIQESVAKKVVQGLNVILSNDEEKKIKKKPTENAEAYELYLKALEYYSRSTRADMERALGLYEEATRLDQGFSIAHLGSASVALEYYRVYSRETPMIERAKEHIAQAESTLGESAGIFRMRSDLLRTLGEFDTALHYAKRAIELDPEFAAAYETLGFAYQSLGRREEAASARERSVKLQKNNRTAYFGYLMALAELRDATLLEAEALKALPLYERHVRLTPDDLHAQVHYAMILGWAGDHDRSLLEARKLEAIEGLDGGAVYNLACLYLHEGETESGLSALRKSVDRGFVALEMFHGDPDLDPLRGTPEFEALIKELEAKIAAGANG